jgi:predicted Rdx family selenoprotein
MPLDVAGRLCTIPCTRLLRTPPPLTPSIQFGQELLSTFGTQIGEIALIPATGGLFTVELVSYIYLRGKDLGIGDQHETDVLRDFSETDLRFGIR